MRADVRSTINRGDHADDRFSMRSTTRAMVRLRKGDRHWRPWLSLWQHVPRPSASMLRLCCAILGLIITAMLISGCTASLNSEIATPSQARLSALAVAEPGADRFVPTAQSLPTPSIDRMAYKIGPLDVLDISVFRVPELSTSVQVAETGTVNLPLLGEVPAAGKTAEDVERDLAEKLEVKYLQSPQVTVFVREYNSQRVTVEGAVRKPGIYPIKGGTTLLQSIASAQGLQSSYDSTVLVFRQTGNQRSAAKFDIDAIKNGQSADPPVNQGDVIVVNSSSAKKAFNHVLRIIPAVGTFVPLML